MPADLGAWESFLKNASESIQTVGALTVSAGGLLYVIWRLGRMVVDRTEPIVQKMLTLYEGQVEEGKRHNQAIEETQVELREALTTFAKNSDERLVALERAVDSIDVTVRRMSSNG